MDADFQLAVTRASEHGWLMRRCCRTHYQLWAEGWLLNLYPTTMNVYASPPGATHPNHVPKALVRMLKDYVWSLTDVITQAERFTCERKQQK